MADGNSNNDSLGAQFSHRLHGAEHGPPRVHSVIDDQGSLLTQRRRDNDFPMLQVLQQKELFFLGHSVNFLWSYPQLPDQGLIEVEVALIRDVSNDNVLEPGNR